MNIKRLSIISLIIALLLPCSDIAYAKKVQDNRTKGIILIDPGHGGLDGGAQSANGTIEKDINLSISKKLKKELEQVGYKVYLTREEDKEISTRKVEDLDARCNMKKETNCDVFISIHQNKFSKASCYGAQVWYASNDKSCSLATYIQECLKQSIEDGNKRLAKEAKDQYRILRDNYDGACVIVECGFLSNYEEEQKLKDSAYQDKIVEGIKNGVEQYYKTRSK